VEAQAAERQGSMMGSSGQRGATGNNGRLTVDLLRGITRKTGTQKFDLSRSEGQAGPRC